MLKYLQKILFIIISFSFFVSATEIDLGECHNTFFDEYDSYLKADQDIFDCFETAKQEYTSSILFNNPFFSYNSFSGKRFYKRCILSLNPLHFPKLFLRNSVWRI